jgi:hypothetical protein
MPTVRLAPMMGHGLVIASIDRAGSHLILLLIAAVGGLVYALVRLVIRKRAARSRSDRPPEGTPGPEE